MAGLNRSGHFGWLTATVPQMRGAHSQRRVAFGQLLMGPASACGGHLGGRTAKAGREFQAAVSSVAHLSMRRPGRIGVDFTIYLTTTSSLLSWASQFPQTRRATTGSAPARACQAIAQQPSPACAWPGVDSGGSGARPGSCLTKAPGGSRRPSGGALSSPRPRPVLHLDHKLREIAAAQRGHREPRGASSIPDGQPWQRRFQVSGAC
jgi:hypothetical protein